MRGKQINRSADHNSQFIGLVGAILSPDEFGVEYPAYIKGPCGQFWCDVGGLDPQALLDMWSRITGKPRVVFTPVTVCGICRNLGVFE